MEKYPYAARTTVMTCIGHSECYLFTYYSAKREIVGRNSALAIEYALNPFYYFFSDYKHYTVYCYITYPVLQYDTAHECSLDLHMIK